MVKNDEKKKATLTDEEYQVMYKLATTQIVWIDIALVECNCSNCYFSTSNDEDLALCNVMESQLTGASVPKCKAGKDAVKKRIREYSGKLG